MSKRDSLEKLFLPLAEGRKLEPAEEARQRLDGTFTLAPLDAIASNLGLVRMAGEDDDAFRERCMQVFRNR